MRARRYYEKGFCCQYEAWTGVPLETNHVWLIKDNWPSSLMPSGQRTTAQSRCREVSTMGSFKSVVCLALNIFWRQYEAWTGIPIESSHIWPIRDHWPSILISSGQRLAAPSQWREASRMGSFKSEVYFCKVFY